MRDRVRQVVGAAPEQALGGRQGGEDALLREAPGVSRGWRRLATVGDKGDRLDRAALAPHREPAGDMDGGQHLPLPDEVQLAFAPLGRDAQEDQAPPWSRAGRRPGVSSLPRPSALQTQKRRW